MSLPGLDPTDMCVASDGTVVVGTLTEVSHPPPSSSHMMADCCVMCAGGAGERGGESGGSESQLRASGCDCPPKSP